MKILIVGGSGGIGSALAASLADAGHETHITYRKNRAAAERMERERGIRTIELDWTDDRSLAAMAERMRKEPYEGLVLLAAEPHAREFFAKSDPAEILRYLDRGLKGPLALTQAFGAAARERKVAGSVVYVLSSVVFDAPPEKQSAYVTLKYALWGLAKAQSVEFGRYGVRVNCVSPGMTQTAFNSDLPERFIETYVQTLPSKRLIEPREVADAIRSVLLPGPVPLNGVNVPVVGGAA